MDIGDLMSNSAILVVLHLLLIQTEDLLDKQVPLDDY